nr:winged helix-turn-helix transcriptional regulator [uncultured Methanospirillum sp.]
MQYTNLGFAFGFFLISLSFPLDCPIHESRISLPDVSGREENETGNSLPRPRDKAGMDYHSVWSTLFADIDQAYRTLLRQLRGYRRITTHNVLEHETRRKVYGLICLNPGIDLARLALLCECNERTLRYHINQIAEKDYITVYNQGKSFHFFENHNAFSLKEQKFLSYYSSGQTGKILSLIHQKPGVTRRELADHLGVSSPTATRMVQILVHEECVHLVKEGKYTRHFLTGDSCSIIQRIIPA